MFHQFCSWKPSSMLMIIWTVFWQSHHHLYHHHYQHLGRQQRLRSDERRFPFRHQNQKVCVVVCHRVKLHGTIKVVCRKSLADRVMKNLLKLWPSQNLLVSLLLQKILVNGLNDVLCIVEKESKSMATESPSMATVDSEDTITNRNRKFVEKLDLFMAIVSKKKREQNVGKE